MASFEVIGNREKAVVIIEPSKNKKENKKNAKELLNKSKNIKSVLLKLSKRKGNLRKRKYELLLGDKNTEVIHKEYGYLIKVDPQKVYFSPRELTERQRIASQVKKNERILVMFSGVAPMIIAIKKKQPTTELYGIELNKSAHNYALENIKLNKLDNVKLIQGDVNKEIPLINKKFDRILMPLPKTAERFLGLALSKIKKNGTIHYYSWGKKGEYSEIKKVIEEKARNCNKKIRILRVKKVLPYAPRIYKLAIDIKCL